MRSTHDSSFRPTHPPLVSPTDFCEELGPRSLDPDRSFWSAFAELIRGQTSLTDFCNCVYDVRATKPELFDPRREGGLDLLPFLRRLTPSPLAGSGETWRAALRSSAATPVPVLPACAGLPDRDAASAAPPPRLAPAEHSEDQRARVEGPSEGRVPCTCATISCAHEGAYAWWRMPTTFPSSAPFGHPVSPARSDHGRIPVKASGPT